VQGVSQSPIDDWPGELTPGRLYVSER